MVYVGNDGHVTDVPLFVHHPTDLVYCKVHLENNEYVCEMASPLESLVFKASTKIPA